MQAWKPSHSCPRVDGSRLRLRIKTMDKVTGTKQYRSIVIQDRPGRRLAIQLGVVVVLVLTTVAAYWVGGKTILSDYRQLKAENTQLRADLAETISRYQEASQQLVNQSLGSEVDRQAVEEIRAVVREHKQTITKLNEEISFYKGLMAPTERERGLGIRSWEIYPTSDPGRFQYKLVMQQLALKHTVLKGAVTVTLVGRRAGIEQNYTLDILSEQVANKDIALRFKYFQYIDGELLLPKDFEVDRVDIVARASAPKTVTVEKHYGWIVQTEGV